MRRFLPSICSAVTARDNFGIKEIHTFAKEYLSSWFPKLPSYQVFNTRLNMLAEAFKTLVGTMIQSFKPEDCAPLISIVDSMPIVTSKGKNRHGKVATEISSKKDIARPKTCTTMA